MRLPIYYYYEMKLHTEVNVSQRLALIKAAVLACGALAIVAGALVFTTGIFDSNDSIAGTVHKTVSGRVFIDQDQNKQYSLGEALIANSEVLLYVDNNGDSIINEGDALIDQTTTNHAGRYEFLLEESYLEGEVVSQISSYEDDANELADGTIELHDNDLHIGYRLGATRFDELNIPQGAFIEEAFISFNAQDQKHGKCKTFIYAEDVDNAQPFKEEENNISNRNMSSEYVAWEPDNWNQGDINHSPSIAALVQKVVNRPNWESGNAMVFVYAKHEGHRDASTREEHLKKGPTLYIRYNLGDRDKRYLVKLNKNSLNKGNSVLGKAYYSVSNFTSDEDPKSFDFPVWSEALPLKWKSFAANNVIDNVDLHWTVEEEDHTSHFEIQKSTDGMNWMVLDEIVAIKTTNGIADYSSFDYDPDPDMNYYRIKRVDVEGGIRFSKTEQVKFGNSHVDIYPIPANDYLHIRPSTSQEVALRVLDASGKVILSENIAELYTLSTSALAQGVYFIQTGNGSTANTKRVLIQH